MLCADYGASVLRIDRAHPQAHSGAPRPPPPPTPDLLTRRKASIAVDARARGGAALVRALAARADVVIDPFRPGGAGGAGAGAGGVAGGECEVGGCAVDGV